MKKLLCALSAGVCSVGAVLADAVTYNSTGAATEFTGSTAETIVQGASQTLQGFLTGAAGWIAGTLIAGLAIYGGIMLVRVVIRAFNAGKDR